MSKLYDELVPVPADCHIHNCNGRVNSHVVIENGQRPRRKVIGRICPQEEVTAEILKGLPKGTKFMYPNDAYFDMYGAEYLKYNPKGREKVKKTRLSVGMYALILAIVIKLGVYKLLIKHYGASNANAILDYAMYSIIYQKDEANTFCEMMGDHVLFSRQPYNDKWYSAFFKNVMTEEKNQDFLDDWLDYNIAQQRVQNVSISVDGTNLNCESKTNSLAANGHAKSNKHIKIVTMLWAVIASGPHKGMPLTYTIDVGSIPDNVEMATMLSIWDKHEVPVKMSIYDRGFPNDKLLHQLNEKGIPFLVMLKENNEGFKTMFDKHWKDLREDFSYVLRSGNISGVTEDGIRPYKNSDLKLCTGLFYDNANGSDRQIYCARKIMDSRDEWEQKLNRKKEKGDIREGTDFSSILPKWFFAEEVDGKIKVGIRNDQVNDIWIRKGYFAQAANVHMTAQVMNDEYNLRDASEKQFNVLKSQLGFNVGNVSGVTSWENKLFVVFIAAIVRNEIMRACRKERIDTNKFIQQTAQLCYSRTDDFYFYSEDFPERVANVLRHFGIVREHMTALGVYVNSRYNESNETQDEVRTIPGFTGEDSIVVSEETPLAEKKVLEDSNDSDATDEKNTMSSEMAKKRGGRKPGCKNLKTREREKREEEERKRRQEEGLPPVQKRKPGRPKGSKNKKTLEREEAERQRRIAEGLPAEEPPRQKRKPGRPVSNKNGKNIETEAESHLDQEGSTSIDPTQSDEKTVMMQNPAKPHKGRTKGTKNKKTIEREAREAELRAAGLLPDPVEKRKPGRPKGVKNKSTIERDERDRILASITGVDILGEKSGIPTSRKVRARLRREAEAKYQEMDKDSSNT